MLLNNDCMHVHMYICMYNYALCVCTHILCMHVCMYVCMYLYVHKNERVRIYCLRAMSRALKANSLATRKLSYHSNSLFSMLSPS